MHVQQVLASSLNKGHLIHTRVITKLMTSEIGGQTAVFEHWNYRQHTQDNSFKQSLKWSELASLGFNCVEKTWSCRSDRTSGSKTAIAKRLSWATKHRRCMTEDCDRVLWIDESKVQIFKEDEDDGRALFCRIQARWLVQGERPLCSALWFASSWSEFRNMLTPEQKSKLCQNYLRRKNKMGGLKTGAASTVSRPEPHQAGLESAGQKSESHVT